MEQRRLLFLLSTILFFSAAVVAQATVITNTISIDMTAATPTVDCTRSNSTSCSSAISNLNFTDISGVETLTFTYTSTSGNPDNALFSFEEYTRWVDDTSTVVGTLLVRGTGSSNSYSVTFCEPSCSTTGYTVSPFDPVTVGYTQFQQGFEMDVNGVGTFTTPVQPGHTASQAVDIYNVKLEQQESGTPEPATLPLMVMAGAFGAFVLRRNLVKAARRVGSSR
jgi:hypothetical protein